MFMLALSGVLAAVLATQKDSKSSCQLPPYLTEKGLEWC